LTIPESNDRVNCVSVVLYSFASVVTWIAGVISGSERRFILRFKSILDGDDFEGMLSVGGPEIFK